MMKTPFTTTLACTLTEALAFAEPATPDHPFLFLIRENTTGSILFMGRMADPTDQ